MTRVPYVGNKERRKWVVSHEDVWSFDIFLLTALANGLDIMAKEAHGWPESEEFPTFDSWVDALREAADDAYWLLVTKEELWHQAHDDNNIKTIFVDSETGAKMGESAFPTGKKSTTIRLQTTGNLETWRAATEELEVERLFRQDRLLTFVKDNFESLWT